MKAVLQRVRHSRVVVDEKVVGEIGHGLMVLIGFSKEDEEALIKKMVQKILHLRVFSNEDNKFDRSLIDVDGSLLVVPQFTLYASTQKGRRPDFFDAKEPHEAKHFFESFCLVCEELGVKHVERGKFGAEMFVTLENHGPVTIILEM